MALHSSFRPDAISALSRRRLIQSLGLLGAAPWLARAEWAAAAAPLSLPLHVRELVNHIGTSVPDVTRSATFYSRLFQSGALRGQEKPALRYEIDFRPGALSIGPLSSQNTTQKDPYIDHFCIVASPFDAAAWSTRLDEEKLRHFAGGSFVVIGGISVQLFGGRAEPSPAAANRGSPERTAAAPHRAGPPPGAAAGGFQPMAPLFDGSPLVTPHGFEHLTVRVADLNSSAALFTQLFGLTPQASSSGERIFRVADIRLQLRESPSGEQPGIKAFAIRVAPYDPRRVRAALEELGAKAEPAETNGGRSILRFADPDGIRCELWA